MPKSKKKNKSSKQSERSDFAFGVPIVAKPGVAELVAPEDIRIGDIVIVHEDRSDFFCCTEFGPFERTVVFSPDIWPTYGRVVAVSLPFIGVREFCGQPSMLDTRRHRLARLPEHFASAMKPCDRSSRGC